MEGCPSRPIAGLGSNTGTTRRAFGAATFEEEKQFVAQKLYASCRRDESGSPEDGAISVARIIAFRASLELQAEFEADKVSHELRSDREMMLLIVSVNGELLKFSLGNLRDDVELALAAVESSNLALEHVGLRLRSSKEIVLAAVKQSGTAIRFAGEPCHADREIMLCAVQMDHFALEYASKELQADRELVMAALKVQTARLLLKNNFGPSACPQVCSLNVLQYASEELRADPEIVLEAAKYNPAALALASEHLRKDKDFVLRAVRNHPPGLCEVTDIEDEFYDRSYCFEEADPTIRTTLSWYDFEPVVDSLLACQGDDAPVLSISLSKINARSSVDESVQPSPPYFQCKVTLMSGSSFGCTLADSFAKSSNADADAVDTADAVDAEPSAKRQRTGETSLDSVAGIGPAAAGSSQPDSGGGDVSGGGGKEGHDGEAGSDASDDGDGCDCGPGEVCDRCLLSAHKGPPVQFDLFGPPRPKHVNVGELAKLLVEELPRKTGAQA